MAGIVAQRLWSGEFVPIYLRCLVRLPPMPDRVISSLPWRVPPAAWAGAAIVGALAAGAVLLWAHYGSAVFFEMIMAGLAFCF
jgi:hypothetical protein